MSEVKCERTKEKGSTCGLCCTQIKNISVKKGKQFILQDVNLHIHCGELTALIGVNGAGKSTLLKTLLGEIIHTGDIIYTDSKTNFVKKPIMGYVPQKLDFDLSSPLSVLDLFASTLSKRPTWLPIPKKIREHVKQSLRKVDAEYVMDRKLGVLSGGEIQRVLLALALEPIPNILLLDEPVSGIDQNGLKLFYETVANIKKNYDLSIILVSHDLQLVAQYADRVALLDKGTIKSAGKVEEVFTSKEVRELFDIKFYQDREEK